MPPPSPTATSPPRSACSDEACRVRQHAVRPLRARAVLHGALRLLRLQHLHRRRSSAASRRLAGDVRRQRRSPRSASRRRVLGDRDAARSRRSSSAAARRPCCRAGDLARMLGRDRDEFGLADDAEVTTEANPDSRRRRRPRPRCATAGFNRISLRHAVRGRRTCCHVLDRTHDPSGVPAVVDWARAAGFDQVSLDLIYGTPGESLADWRDLARRRAGAASPTTSRRYALIVEDGTALARQVRRGELPMPDDDDLADKYLTRRRAAHRRRAAAGTRCPTGPRRPSSRCRHNLALLARRRLVGRRPRRALATSAGCAGGTSSTRRRTPSGSPPALSPATAREVLGYATTGGSSGSCWRSGCATDSR